MNFSCCICFSNFKANDDIVSTACGHIFHEKCLNEWIERTKNCPQCRKNTPASKIQRLYLNLEDNNMSINHDDGYTRALQNEIADLHLQIASLQNNVLNLRGQLAKKDKTIKAENEKCRKYLVAKNMWKDHSENLEEKSRLEVAQLKKTVEELTKNIERKDKELKHYQHEYFAMSAQVRELKSTAW